MSAVVLRASRLYSNALAHPRRLFVAVIMLTAIFAVSFAVTIERASRSIDYHPRFVVSTPAVVCPGEKITYPVNITINHSDAVSRVTEGWCRADGICPNNLQNAPVYFNFIESYETSREATRVVPAELTPGVWHLRHCNETHASSVIDVVCYQVQVMVEACQ